MAFFRVFFVLILAGYLNCAVENEDTLELLQVLIRHGNRTAIDIFDEYRSWYYKTFRPFQHGQLIPQGRRHMYEVGTYFRQRYSNFLPEEYSYRDVSVRCTGTKRVQESAAVTMAAMFPPKSLQKWGDSDLGAAYTPIPCQCLPENQDTVLDPMSVDCPRQEKTSNEYYSSSDFRTKYNELTRNESVNEYIRSSLNLSDPLDYTGLIITWENLIASENYGVALPSWSKQVYPEPLTKIRTLISVGDFCTEESIRFTVGELMKEILETGDLCEKGKISPKSRKMFAYFGHDRTIMTMLVALGFETMPAISNYGAALIMELHRNKTTSEIGYKFLYRNGAVDPIVYVVPGCQEICPLSYINKYVEPCIPKRPFYSYC